MPDSLFPPAGSVWVSTSTSPTRMRVLGHDDGYTTQCEVLDGILKGEIRRVHYLHFDWLWLPEQEVAHVAD